jgi:ABC-type Zn uptake system ZnuABC Zn-binding protein ZnuA
VAGCQQSSAPGSKPAIVASIFPVYEFTRQVASSRAQVVLFVPAGAEPHDWEPSPQDIAVVGRARVFEGLTREEAAAGKAYLDLMMANLETLREGLGCR